MSKEKLSYAQQVCVKSAGKAMQRTGMVGPGAKVGVAVSGGVDSWVLLECSGGASASCRSGSTSWRSI